MSRLHPHSFADDPEHNGILYIHPLQDREINFSSDNSSTVQWLEETDKRLREGARNEPKEPFDPKQRLIEPCCDNEQRNMNGGCDNCGDPCL